MTMNAMPVMRPSPGYTVAAREVDELLRLPLPAAVGDAVGRLRWALECDDAESCGIADDVHPAVVYWRTWRFAAGPTFAVSRSNPNHEVLDALRESVFGCLGLTLPVAKQRAVWRLKAASNMVECRVAARRRRHARRVKRSGSGGAVVLPFPNLFSVLRGGVPMSESEKRLRRLTLSSPVQMSIIVPVEIKDALRRVAAAQKSNMSAVICDAVSTDKRIKSMLAKSTIVEPIDKARAAKAAKAAA